MQRKNLAKKVWDFIWNSNNPLSWLVALALAFIIVKFVVFPLLSLSLATPLPFVVVESCSMYHPPDFDDYWNKYNFGRWYEERNITREQFEKFSFSKGLDKGDIILVYGRNKPELGDIIIFKATQKTPIIHRIVRVREEDGRILSTKGDNNCAYNNKINEENVNEEQVLGKAVARLPKLGWVKLFFVVLFKREKKEDKIRELGRCQVMMC